MRWSFVGRADSSAPIVQRPASTCPHDGEPRLRRVNLEPDLRDPFGVQGSSDEFHPQFLHPNSFMRGLQLMRGQRCDRQWRCRRPNPDRQA